MAGDVSEPAAFEDGDTALLFQRFLKDNEQLLRIGSIPTIRVAREYDINADLETVKVVITYDRG